MLGILDNLLEKWRMRKYLHKWKQVNHDNFTIPTRAIPFECIKIGRGTYGKLTVLNCTLEAKLTIGNYCSIAEEVTFLLSVDHSTNHLFTYLFKAMYEDTPCATTKGDIIIEDDVWLGYRSTILSGVRIGKGAIVAAGAVVSKDVPPYAIVGGVPARVLKYRFSDTVIKELIDDELSSLSYNEIVDRVGKIQLNSAFKSF